MSIGRGLYGDIAHNIRVNTDADLVLLLVLISGGDSGMSVQSIDPDEEKRLPKMLRELADQIENGNFDKGIRN